MLECELDRGDPKARVTWYKGTKEVYSGGKIHIDFQDNTASLDLKETSVSDGGMYRCEAVNKLGRVETQCTLEVQSKLVSI